MNNKHQIEKLKKAQDLILQVRDAYKGFGEYSSYQTIAENISEHIKILDMVK